MGLSHSLTASTLFQVIIKLIVCRFRPHFLTICRPRPSAIYTGCGRHSIWCDARVCTERSWRKLTDAQGSFPSGHSCAAFASFGFLALYFNAHLGVWGSKEEASSDVQNAGEGQLSEMEKKRRKGRGRVSLWKALIVSASLLVAAILAGLKYSEGYHHGEDIVAGSIIGMAFAVWAYRMVYKSVWDQSTNHLPREDGT